jgi:hypothetical protein
LDALFARADFFVEEIEMYELQATAGALHHAQTGSLRRARAGGVGGALCRPVSGRFTHLATPGATKATRRAVRTYRQWTGRL